MYRIKVWIPVEVNPEDDMQYVTKEDAEEEKQHLEELQPDNIYEIEVVEQEKINLYNTGDKPEQVVLAFDNSGKIIPELSRIPPTIRVTEKLDAITKKAIREITRMMEESNSRSKRQMKEEEEEEEEEENIYMDVWDTGEPCSFCGALKGEPHKKHVFL